MTKCIATYKQKLEDTLAASESPVVLSPHHKKCRKNVYNRAEMESENIQVVPSVCMSECEDMQSRPVATDLPADKM